MKKYQIVIIILYIVGLSCNYTGTNNRQVINREDPYQVIDVTEILLNESPSVEDVLDSIVIIPLETSIECLIPGFAQYYVNKSRIYAMTPGRQFTIFDIQGKLIKTLNIGEGPGETVPHNMYFDEEERSLYIYDSNNGKINKYTENGDFLSQYYTNTLIESFIVQNGKIIMAQPGMKSRDGNFHILSLDTITLGNMDSWNLGKDIVNNLGHSHTLHPYNGGFFIERSADNTIYYMNGDSISKKYLIIDDNELEDKDIFGLGGMEKIQRNGFVYTGIYNETDNFNSYYFLGKNLGKIIFVNNITKEQYSWSMKKGVMKYVSFSANNHWEGNWFVGVLDPSLFFQLRESGWDATENNALVSLKDIEKLLDLKEDDNPVIVLFKLKDK